MPPIFSTCGMEVLKDDNQDKTPLGLGSVAGHHGGIIVWEQLSPGLPQTEKEPRGSSACTHWKLPSASAHSKAPGVTPGSS